MSEKEISRTKITYIIPTLDSGGAERFFVDLIKNLDREKFEASLILYKRAGLWLGELEREGIKCVVLEKKFLFDISNFIAIYKSIKEIGPDIVHTQLGADIYGVLAAKLAGIRSIVSTEVNTNINESYLYNCLKKFSLRFVDRVIAVSSAVLNDAKKRYKINKKKLEVIYNGIEIERFSIKEKRNNFSDDNPIVFGTIGRLTEQKGHINLIKAFSMLSDKNAKLLIAGKGELKDDLNQLIITLGLQKRVELCGKVLAPKFLNEIDVFVLPSIWEGMGIVLVEAALTGLPIIASDVGGVSEVVSSEEAWLVEPGNIEDLRKTIDSLIINFETIETGLKIEKANKRAREMFDITIIADNYQKLYQKLIRSYENTAGK